MRLNEILGYGVVWYKETFISDISSNQQLETKWCLKRKNVGHLLAKQPS